MPETIYPRPSELLLDENNPRLPQPNKGQREVWRELARDQGTKIVTLAGDILRHGLNPADLMIVRAQGDEQNRYVVLEGNRRLVALKALENPEPLTGAIDDVALKRLREMSREYQSSPIENVPCALVKDAEEAKHWIELRHTGENLGAGIVPWRSDDAERFRARGGVLRLHSQALNFLETQGVLTPQERRDIPATGIERLLGTPQVREKLGLDVEAGQLKVVGRPERVTKALMYIVDEIRSGNLKVEKIYTKTQRIEFAELIPKKFWVEREPDRGEAEESKKPEKRPRPRPYRSARQRMALIPGDCVMQVRDARSKQIEMELRRIGLETFPNAVSVLFRVFLELSVDSYISRHKLKAIESDKLAAKMQAVVNDLTDRSLLTRLSAAPVRKAMQRESFLVPSIDVLHGYVHNPHIFPAPGDLRAAWDSLQPFFVAMWSV
jgi:hypothetical protein